MCNSGTCLMMCCDMVSSDIMYRTVHADLLVFSFLMPAKIHLITTSTFLEQLGILRSYRALQDYHSTVQPALEASGIRHELHVTHAAGHATDILRNLTCGDVDKPPFDAVLMMGGDGTVHEALQVSACCP
jgi:NAD kinase